MKANASKARTADAETPTRREGAPLESSRRGSPASLRRVRGRDPALRRLYLTTALASIPRVLGAADRNPYRMTYGCFDREFWHYRTSSFPSEMYQEGVLPLALVWAYEMPGNRWHGDPRVRELVVAGLEFSARSCHMDGSCDDYYPFERALGAAVFSLQAAARAYQLLGLDSPTIRAWLERRANWIMNHDESGKLANHHALASLGLWRVAQITGRADYMNAADDALRRVLAWQHREGWFDEYGGADPGYQTVTIDCLAKLGEVFGRRLLDAPLRRAVAFARWFLHPDDSFGGEYGSRGTYQFYPHGFELLAGCNEQASQLADGFLRALAAGRHAYFDDDRMYVHRLGNLIEAYLDWSPDCTADDERRVTTTYLPAARLLVRQSGETRTIVSAARGGVFKHFTPQQRPTTDAGLIVETIDGRIAVSQSHDLERAVEWDEANEIEMRNSTPTGRLTVAGPLHWVRFETVTPLKQAVFHWGMWTLGRCCRSLARRFLQRRLITGRDPCPIRLTRIFEFASADRSQESRVIDHIELRDRRIRIRRMSFASDLQAAYVAASDVYQESVLQPWTDLGPHVAELNARREVTIARELPTTP
ncbi:MAG TPA: hypothetical protein VMV69_21380 [Pirellulales bacterium]|nr:hypothetical protein [Pirellulales bacterium]